jgi:hypothetical protein
MLGPIAADATGARLVAPPAAERVLVIRLGALGDVVRTRYAFAGVRALYPRAHIEWLVEDRAAAGLVGLPGLDGRVEVPRRKLRARHPLVALATLREFAAELRAPLRPVDRLPRRVPQRLPGLGREIPVRVGYGPPIAKESSHWFQTLRAPVHAAHMSRFEAQRRARALPGRRGSRAPHVLELDGARGSTRRPSGSR